MTRSNSAPLLPLDEDINRTLRLLARKRELAEAMRSEIRGQHLGPGVSGEEVEEVEVELVVVVEMAWNQRQDGASQACQLNDAAEEEEAPRMMGYYIATRPADI
ncbi:unnamed protein product [Linum trigynum]|uniref:Uncharacterized protein n=1 Tax=Linum trigynum TaxID=586398 RepID=A0AAV2E642_9ROSI